MINVLEETIFHQIQIRCYKRNSDRKNEIESWKRKLRIKKEEKDPKNFEKLTQNSFGVKNIT